MTRRPGDDVRVVRRLPPSAKTPRGVASRGLGVLAAISSQIVVVTAILYYFGWARVQATYGYFGLDTGALGLSTADFVLRSIPVAFGTLVAGSLLALVASAIHVRLVIPRIGTPRGRRELRVATSRARIVGVLVLGGVVLCMVPGMPLGPWLGLALPILLIIAAGTLAYVDHVRSAALMASGGEDMATRTTRAVRRLGLVMLVFVGVVWGLGAFASLSGARAAENIASSGREVILYSTQRLALSGPGVHVVLMGQPDSKYLFQYTGMRLLARGPGKYYLLPLDWRPGQAAVFTVSDVDSVRIDLR